MVFALFRKASSAGDGGRPDATEAAHALYTAAVAQSRAPAFYAVQGVPDTLDGRFDMIALHVYLVLRRLKRPGGEPEEAARAAARVAQALFDLFFADMDQSLREIGVGDMGIGKRIKAMAKGFYGRIDAYDAGLTEGDAALGSALRRNLYGTQKEEPAAEQLTAVVTYLRTADTLLAGQDLNDFLNGACSFPPPPDADTSS